MARNRVLALVVMALGGCTVGVDEGNDEVAEIAGGRADNFLSPVSSEYDFTTQVVLELSEEERMGTAEEQLARAQELASQRIEAITKALDTKVWELWNEESRASDHSLLLRIESDLIEGLEPTDAGYAFTYRVEAGGPNDLFSRFPFEREGSDYYLSVTVESTTYRLKVEPSAVSADAYPQYLELFEDGLDIAIHVGDDHRSDTTDISQARDIYNALVSEFKFKSPVRNFDQLGLTSGAFTRTIRVGATTVNVRATLFHSKMAPTDQLDLLVDAYKTSARTADIVIYHGHAGRTLTYSGVVVHYNPRVAIPASEFRNLELPEKYQVFVFAGCETYTGYADEFYDHPMKDTTNADVITTTNFTTYRSTANSVRGFLAAILASSNGSWRPQSWNAVLETVTERDSGGRWTGMFGVHGLDDNPRISPLANVDLIGEPCSGSRDCGAVDSLCVNRNSVRQCGAACTDDTGCPEGRQCVVVESRSLGSIGQCL